MDNVRVDAETLGGFGVGRAVGLCPVVSLTAYLAGEFTGLGLLAPDLRRLAG